LKLLHDLADETTWLMKHRPLARMCAVGRACLLSVYVRSRRIVVNEFAFRIKRLEEFQSPSEVIDLRTDAWPLAAGIARARR
jgi:hypothetical protein